ncbi:glucose-6-phosphate dehydrogenase [Aciditerrimonas ferrireducens]|uniref:glucose-6-phosphate dehydrogenase n=1 Tax=Aciditerrimonas ferrireducens TaxID=667306 RepID=UPI002004A394|nr:glucose-6-phosphate dehydrogenase [Aciditerrimonas ferrireducens]MCK4177759.1 glucose-6-phosphate dehydrogenase [Aciditerrimonas ferrireducens]
MSQTRADQHSRRADALVIFGITGDLAAKMTFRALYRLEEHDRLRCPVYGVGRQDWSNEELVRRARAALDQGGLPVDEAVFDRLARRLHYHGGDLADPATYRRLAEELQGRTTPVFYLEVPPSLFATVVQGLHQAGLTEGARVVVEKPFGRDLASARALAAELHRYLDERQLLRIDHFLGKEPVLDLQYLRFANAVFEPLWNRSHVAAVQLTLAEDFGVEGRGGFYDPVGALRDVVQNHLLQVLALVAMEPPVGAGPDAVQDKKLEVFRAMPPAEPARAVRGQYQGYRDVEGVAKDSTTETFVALRLAVDNWRWSGVPFLIRAGKKMTMRCTEVRVIFRRPPRLAFLDEPARPEPSQVVVRIDPDPGVRLVLLAKGHDRGVRRVHLDLSFAEQLGVPPEPYERLLHDALEGDASLFSRQDLVEETWRIVQPLLDSPPPLEPYEPGSMGPRGADELVRGLPPWHEPWLEPTSGGAG